MNERHAYMIACHNNHYILQKLLSSLDDERNDIYLHADKRWKDFDKKQVAGILKNATITFVKRRKVNWGGFSQVKNTMTLLKEAVKAKHSYYHFISGVDMPLKTQDYIHNFFKENNGKEFVSIDEDSHLNQDYISRIKYFYPFQEIIGRFDFGIYKYIRILQNLMLDMQKTLNTNRLKGLEGKIYKGANWFSITNEFAEYVVANERFIKKHFSKSVCSDELFMQTLIMNSKFCDNIASFSIRHIDWKRGAPYTFRICDSAELKQTEDLFARKFDENVDIDIVDDLYEHISAEQGI